jgi:tetratricopeptide (TPR) repeat protein
MQLECAGRWCRWFAPGRNRVTGKALTVACCAVQSVIFLLRVSAGELDALRENAHLAGNEEVESRRRKKRKKIVVDLHNPCIAWIEEAEDLKLAAGIEAEELDAAVQSLPSPYRNTVRQEEQEEEEHKPLSSPTGKSIPKSWMPKKPAAKPPASRPGLGSYLLLEAGAFAQSSGNLTAASGFFRRAVELLPTSAAPLNKLGGAMEAAGDYEGATSVYRRVVSEFPKDVTGRMRLAQV